MTHLASDRYGKSGIRLVTVRRDGAVHHLQDCTVDIWLGGAFGPAYTRADNSSVLPTDTMRGTVYAFARQHPTTPIEPFALRLARHFVADVGPVSSAEVHASSVPWRRIDGHEHAFVRVDEGRRTVVVRARDGGQPARVECGLRDLRVLKSADSAFSGFLVDEYTTLAETDDRVLATAVTARWSVHGEDHDWDALHDAVRATLLTTFARHDSASVQHTLYAMGDAVIAARPEVGDVFLSMPNLHHHLVDLSPYGLDNPHEVFVATDEPYGAIEAVVARDG